MKTMILILCMVCGLLFYQLRTVKTDLTQVKNRCAVDHPLNTDYTLRSLLDKLAEAKSTTAEDAAYEKGMQCYREQMVYERAANIIADRAERGN